MKDTILFLQGLEALESKAPFGSPYFGMLRSDAVSRFWTRWLSSRVSPEKVRKFMETRPDHPNWGDLSVLCVQMTEGFNPDFVKHGGRQIMFGIDLWDERSLTKGNAEEIEKAIKALEVQA